MTGTTIRFTSYPRTKAPPKFIQHVVDIFISQESKIASEILDRHLKSDEVLLIVGKNLIDLGFQVETSKSQRDRISRPVFFGENGKPTLRYEVDAYHTDWRCGLEIEGIRAIRGGALYRDLIQALVMVEVDHLVVAVPNLVKWGQTGMSKSYNESIRTVEALYGHDRFNLPYGLTVIGY